MKNPCYFVCVIPCLLVLFVNLSLVSVRKLWARSGISRVGGVIFLAFRPRAQGSAAR